VCFCSGVSLQHGSNSFYPKFLTETNRSAPPPCRGTARLAEKLPLQFLICARHQKILLKGKGNFSAWLRPQLFGQGGGASLPARGQKVFLPFTHPFFCPRESAILEDAVILLL
jgi:hypothetical protein